MFNTAEANAGDTNNYDVSREGVGKAADLPDKIAQLYHLVYEGIVPTLDTDQRKAAAILCLTLNAKHLILGINSLVSVVCQPDVPRSAKRIRIHCHCENDSS